MRKPEESNGDCLLEAAKPRSGEPVAAGNGEAAPAPATGLSQILEQFDVRAVRAQADRFAPYKDQLVAWLQNDLLPLDKLGLSTGDQPAVAPVEEPEGHYRATWHWPDERLTDACLLAVCPATSLQAGR